MIELTGKILDMSLDFRSGKPKLTLELNGQQAAKCLYDEYNQEEKLSIKFSKYRKKRSLNANALCWKLCTEIANVLRSSKEAVYVDMLRKYGQSDVVSVLSSVNVTGYFKYFDEFGKGYVNGKEFTHYRIYKGSSEYDTLEMSILLDGIVDDAKSLNIPVMSARELSLIKSEWKNQEYSDK